MIIPEIHRHEPGAEHNQQSTLVLPQIYAEALKDQQLRVKHRIEKNV